MPNWKKIITSGSDAVLSNLNVINAITASTISASSNLKASTLTSTGDFTIDSSGDIILDADGTDIILKDDGTEFGSFKRVSSDFVIKSATSDKDIVFKGNDGGVSITALTLDMSEGGNALFTANVSGSSTSTGSFGKLLGDGSDITGISTDVSQVATVSDSFTSATNIETVHNFNTKNVIVSVYDNNDQVIIPDSITTTTVNKVDIVLDTATTGRVVVAKGGHLVTGATVTQNATVTDTFTSQTSVATTHNFGTKNILVTVYDDNDAMIIPDSVVTTDTNTVTTTFDSSTTGRIVVAKGGHVVSGSTNFSNLINTPTLLSSSAQITGDITASSLSTDQYIYHTGDQDTLINFTTNQIRFNAGGINFMSLEKDASTPYPLTVNNGGNRINFRVVDRNSELLFKTNSEEFWAGLYFAGSRKLTTSTSGITVTGSINTTVAVTASHFNGTGSALINVTGSKAVNTRDNSTISFWQGSQAQYDALGSYDSNVIYFTT